MTKITTSPLQSSPLQSSYPNAFAGISGCVSADAALTEPDTQLLLDPSGRWAIRLTSIEPPMARMLLQILRDLSPPATQADSTFIRQVAAFDMAARADTSLIEEIAQGVAALDALARKLTRRAYLEVEERTLRRTLLSQISANPLMDRLGVRTPSYSGAAI